MDAAPATQKSWPAAPPRRQWLAYACLPAWGSGAPTMMKTHEADGRRRACGGRLCVEMKRGRFAKEGLIQYRIVCQQVNVASLEEVRNIPHRSPPTLHDPNTPRCLSRTGPERI